MTRLRICLLLIVPMAASVLAAAGATPTPCEKLANLGLPNTKITLAQSVSEGAFTPPPSPMPPMGPPPSFKDVPAFCRVVAEAAPTPDSDIKIEIWMPASGWNGKFQGVGNGGFAGMIDYEGLGTAVKHGYATAATDTGHSGSPIDAGWALGHPEKVADFGYRGIHLMTQDARAIISAFYGDNPQRAYFASCSDGGREALMEAQRFPEDYNGIIAGAPANYWTHLLTAALWDLQATTLDPASYIPVAKIPAISKAVTAACDAQDGVTDGVLSDPRQCHFDPETIVCKGADAASCLTAPQATALKAIYAGPHDSAGHQVFPGYPPGGEEGGGGWGLWITGGAPRRSLIAFFGLGYFSNMVYGKADWDYKTFTVDDGLKAAEEKTAAVLNSTDPDLKAFRARGGKLILYHGWSDAAIPATNSIDYYNSVAARMGRKAAGSFVRLFMVPGMQHCGGGPGANYFGEDGRGAPGDAGHNIYAALEQWVEKGVAPSMIIATKYTDDNPARGVKMTRPLCAYPQIAKYKGAGDTNDAANFACAKP
ncbi:MAG TPA: tannase/feruloyl esterase family alpha/beta hydrolase [Terriglobia bacterium]|nr:tannase/feruloyl esterase family alpha/beta hydrolase [Terriglobia bacterium]